MTIFFLQVCHGPFFGGEKRRLGLAKENGPPHRRELIFSPITPLFYISSIIKIFNLIPYQVVILKRLTSCVLWFQIPFA
jgi:hypothetical protein